MGKQILHGSFGFSNDNVLPGSQIFVPLVVVGDKVFRIDRHFMKLYTKNSATEDQTKAVFSYKLNLLLSSCYNTLKVLAIFKNCKFILFTFFENI